MRGVIASRWLALLLTLALSFYQWRPGISPRFVGAWNYGLLLLDPRVPAALLWGVQFAAWMGLILLPVAHWLSVRLPRHRPWTTAAAVALAAGLGTRGLVAPLLVRAMAALPVGQFSGGGERVVGWLGTSLGARLAVAVAETMWLLPALVLGLHLIRSAGIETRWGSGAVFNGSTGQRRSGGIASAWKPRLWVGLVLVLVAWLQAMDAPYLLTAGGPWGATGNLQLLAFREGSGRGEWGYACALAVCLGGAALLLASKGILGSGCINCADPAIAAESRPGGAAWLVGLPVVLLPLIVGVLRNPPAALPDLLLPGPTTVTLACALLSAAGTVCAARALAPRLHGGNGSALSWVALTALLLPPLTWVLPLLWLGGPASGARDLLRSVAVLTLALPAVLPVAVVMRLLALRLTSNRGILVAGFSLAAWAAWTEVIIPLLLNQTQPGAGILASATAWSIATHLERSPLSTPGWPAAWCISLLLALPVVRLAACVGPSAANYSE